MTDFFNSVLDFFASVWEFVDWIWNFLQYIFQHFGLTLLIDLVLNLLSAFTSFLSSTAGALGATQMQAGLDDATETLESDTVGHVFNIAGYMMDYFVPIEFLNAFLGFYVSIWFLGLCVSMTLKVYHQFWGSS